MTQALWTLFMGRYAKPLLQKIASDEIFTRAAAVAYSASLSFAPVVILITSFLGLMRLDFVHFLAIQTNRLIGYEVGELVLKLADYSQSHVELASVSGLIGLIILVLSASLFFNQVEQTMSHIFKSFAKIDNGPMIPAYQRLQLALKNKLFSLMVFVLTMAFVIVSLLSSFFLKNLLSHRFPMVYGLAYEAFSFFLFVLLFFMIFLSTPAFYIRRRIVFLGSMATAALFLIGKEFIAFYISTMGIGSLYGATGTIVVFLVWFYYSSLTVFIGAEIISIVALPQQD